MKLLLLRVLLQRRARDEGFTLPLVIGLGLVMTLLGTINLTSANEEKLNAITQNSRSDALAMAEIGVARYRELLDRNRVLAVTDGTAWSGLDQICEGDIADFLPAQSNPITIAEDGQDLNNNGTDNETFDNATDPFPTGSYQLVSYDYVGAANFDVTSDAANNDPVSGNPATGELTVRGTTPDGEGNAQIVVDIPIRINTSDMDNLAPALWIGNNSITNADLGNLTIGNGNVVIQDKAVTTSGSEADGCDQTALATASGLDIISDARNLPSIDSITTTIDTDAGSQVNTTINAEVGTLTERPFVKPPVGETFDPNNHCADIRDCRYYYDLGSLVGTDAIDDDVRADGIAKVTLYIDGDLEIDGSVVNISVGSGAASNYFEIYVKPDGTNNNIEIKTGSSNNVTIDAFIHAPESTLTITGSGTVNINGSVWVKDFDNSDGATVNITPDNVNISSSSLDRAYKFYTTTTDRTPKPITESPSNWRTEDIN